MPDEKTIPTKEQTEATPKRPYQSPKLEDYGSVSGLTQAGVAGPIQGDGTTAYS